MVRLRETWTITDRLVIAIQDWTDLTIILRVFDADLEYGPCSNTR